MEITEKQAFVLEKLHRVVVTKGRISTLYSLDGQSCRYQIVSLAARDLILWHGYKLLTRVMRRADPN